MALNGECLAVYNVTLEQEVAACSEACLREREDVLAVGACRSPDLAAQHEQTDSTATAQTLL